MSVGQPEESGNNSGRRPDGRFDPRALDRTVIAIPLLRQMADDEVSLHDVIIDVNLDYPQGREAARTAIAALVDDLTNSDPDQGIDTQKGRYSQQYLFGKLRTETLRELIYHDRAAASLANGHVAIYRIWLDFMVTATTNVSIGTVKADAARNAFGALGKDIVWAVVDTGIDATHPHFARHANLSLVGALRHRCFIAPKVSDAESEKLALEDAMGHGTHVAGILAGEVAVISNDLVAKRPRAKKGTAVATENEIVARISERSEDGNTGFHDIKLKSISGMAPQCKLLSLKVLGSKGEGLSSNLIAAIEYIQELNGNGRRIQVHGVNMSVGYSFDPEWFACGQSPLCVEVDRLVRSGVVVVVAAGNTGYGYVQATPRGPVVAGLDLTINDPGNAELAITVGSTHREMPHTYGVSYFSSKGPTGDGRMKPDLVAPGEKVISCASSQMDTTGLPAVAGAALYREDSGTSMAAPHVSGVIAAFLSVRREFLGRPLDVKELFMRNATDLKRTRDFQGCGLVDLMRSIQAV
jgi:serine protease AprX